MEQLDQEFVGSTWKESHAIHEEAPGTQDIARQQQSAIDASETQAKIEPIRNQGPRVGRNDPCPCGSGKKYKNCHMKFDQQGGARQSGDRPPPSPPSPKTNGAPPGGKTKTPRH